MDTAAQAAESLNASTGSTAPSAAAAPSVPASTPSSSSPQITFSENSSSLVRCIPNERATFFIKIDCPDDPEILPLKFEWSRGELPIENSDRFRITQTSNAVQLAVEHVQREDAGHYTLYARTKSGSVIRKDVELLVEDRSTGDDPPIFLRRLGDLSVKVGTRTRLLVEIRSSTDVKITWYRNDRRICENDRIKQINEGSFYCIEITPVILEDGGQWMVMAENLGGRNSCIAHLNVLVPKAYKPPEFIEELRAVLTDQGTVSLECKVVGVPTPVLRWFKDSKEIKAGDVFALTANPDDPTSLGTYTCEAVNCMGKSYSSSKVHVVGRGSREGSLKPADSVQNNAPPPIFTNELRGASVRIGDTIILGCQVVVPPWPKTVAWYNKEGRVEANDKYKLIEDGLGVYMIEVKPSESCDEGEWKCVVTSQEGCVGISACAVTMDIPKNFRKPRFMESLKAVLTEEGLVSFECKVVGFPTPTLKWFKDGQELKPGDVYQLTGTNSLGTYCCIAKNCMGESSSVAVLTIEDIENQLNDEERIMFTKQNQPPKFVTGLKTQDAKINEPFRFTVTVKAIPDPVLSWFRDELPIESNERYNHFAGEAETYHLDVKCVEFVDQAEWKCVAVNDFGTSVTSCFLKLQIPRHYKKPRFLECLRAVLTEEGAVNLECKVIGVPQPVLKWYKDGIELKPGDIHRIISGQDGTCCLGTYTCEARNCMGVVASSASLLGFEDAYKNQKPEPPVNELQRNFSLSTIQEERTSQMYESAVGDITIDEKGDISFSFDGKEVSVSLYETPDLTEEEALKIVEMYADQISEHVTEHNIVELPPLRFIKETSQSGNLLMEAVVIDIAPEYFSHEEDMRTEAGMDDISICEVTIHGSSGQDESTFDKETEDYAKKTMEKMEEELAMTAPARKRKKSRGTEVEEYFSLSFSKASESQGDEDTSELQTFASASAQLTSSKIESLEMEEPPREEEIQPPKRKKGKKSPETDSSKTTDADANLQDISGAAGDGLTLLKPSKAVTDEGEIQSNLKALLPLAKLLKTIENHLVVVETEVVSQSAMMMSPTSADQSIGIIRNVLEPIKQIEGKLRVYSGEIPIEVLFESMETDIKALHTGLQVIEKCVAMDETGVTLIQRTSVCIIDSVGDQFVKTFEEVKNIAKSFESEHIKMQAEITAEDIQQGIQITQDTIKSQALLQEAQDIETAQHVSESVAKLQEMPQTLPFEAVTEAKLPSEADSLKLICRPVIKIQQALENIENELSLEENEEQLYSRIHEGVLSNLQGPINELQLELDRIEQKVVAAAGSETIEQKIDMTILDIVTPPLFELKKGLEIISKQSPGNIHSGMMTVGAIESMVPPLQEIQNGLAQLGQEIESGQVKEDFVPDSADTQKLLQSIAQGVLHFETNIERLSPRLSPNLQSGLVGLKDELSRLIGNILDCSLNKYRLTVLENLKTPIDELNYCLRQTEQKSISGSLSDLIDPIRGLREKVKLGVDILSISDLQQNDLNIRSLMKIKEIIKSIEIDIEEHEFKLLQKEIELDEKQATEMDQSFMSMREALSMQIAKEEGQKTVEKIEEIHECLATLQDEVVLEDVKTLTSENISALKKIAKPLKEMLECVATIKSGAAFDTVQEFNENVNMKVLHEIAEPVNALAEALKVVTAPKVVDNLKSLSTQDDISALKTLAQPAQELRNCIAKLGQEVAFEEQVQSFSEQQAFLKIAKPLSELQECLEGVIRQTGAETLEDVSTMDDISALKTAAESISEGPQQALLTQEYQTVEEIEDLELETTKQRKAEILLTDLKQCLGSVLVHCTECNVTSLKAETINQLRATVTKLKELEKHVAEVCETSIRDPVASISDKTDLKTLAEAVCSLESCVVQVQELVPDEGLKSFSGSEPLTDLKTLATPLQELRDCLQIFHTQDFENVDTFTAPKVSLASGDLIEGIRPFVVAVQENEALETLQSLIEQERLESCKQILGPIQQLQTAVLEVRDQVHLSQVDDVSTQKTLATFAKPLINLHEAIVNIQEQFPYSTFEACPEFKVIQSKSNAVYQLLKYVEQVNCQALENLEELSTQADVSAMETYAASIDVDSGKVEAVQIEPKVMESADIRTCVEDGIKQIDSCLDKPTFKKSKDLKEVEIIMKELKTSFQQMQAELSKESEAESSILAKSNIARTLFKLKECLVHTYEGGYEESLDDIEKTFEDILQALPDLEVLLAEQMGAKVVNKIRETVSIAERCAENHDAHMEFISRLAIPLNDLAADIDRLGQGPDTEVSKSSTKMVGLQSRLMNAFRALNEVSESVPNELLDHVLTGQSVLVSVFDFIEATDPLRIIEVFQEIDNIVAPLTGINAVLGEILREAEGQQLFELLKPVKEAQELLMSVQEQLATGSELSSELVRENEYVIKELQSKIERVENEILVKDDLSELTAEEVREIQSIAEPLGRLQKSLEDFANKQIEIQEATAVSEVAHKRKADEEEKTDDISTKSEVPVKSDQDVPEKKAKLSESSPDKALEPVVPDLTEIKAQLGPEMFENLCTLQQLREQIIEVEKKRIGKASKEVLSTLELTVTDLQNVLTTSTSETIEDNLFLPLFKMRDLLAFIKQNQEQKPETTEVLVTANKVFTSILNHNAGLRRTFLQDIVQTPKDGLSNLIPLLESAPGLESCRNLLTVTQKLDMTLTDIVNKNEGGLDRSSESFITLQTNLNELKNQAEDLAKRLPGEFKKSCVKPLEKICDVINSPRTESVIEVLQEMEALKAPLKVLKETMEKNIKRFNDSQQLQEAQAEKTKEEESKAKEVEASEQKVEVTEDSSEKQATGKPVTEAEAVKAGESGKTPLKPEEGEGIKSEQAESKDLDALEKKSVESGTGLGKQAAEKSVTAVEAVKREEDSVVALKSEEATVESTEVQKADVSEVRLEKVETNELEDAQKKAVVSEVAAEGTVAEKTVTEAETVESEKVDPSLKTPETGEVKTEARVPQISEVTPETIESQKVEDGSTQALVEDGSPKESVSDKTVTEPEKAEEGKVTETSVKAKTDEVKAVEAEKAEVSDVSGKSAETPEAERVQEVEKQKADVTEAKVETISKDVKESRDSVQSEATESEVKKATAAGISDIKPEELETKKLEDASKKAEVIEIGSEESIAIKSTTEPEAAEVEEVTETPKTAEVVDVKTPESHEPQISEVKAEKVEHKEVESNKKEIKGSEVKIEKSTAEKSVTEPEKLEVGQMTEIGQTTGELEVKSAETLKAEISEVKAEKIEQKEVEDTKRADIVEVNVPEAEKSEASEVKPEKIELKEVVEYKKEVDIKDVDTTKSMAEKSVTGAELIEVGQVKETSQTSGELDVKPAEALKSEVSEVKAETVVIEGVEDSSKKADLVESSPQKGEITVTEPEKAAPGKVEEVLQKLTETDIQPVEAPKAEVSEVKPEKIEEKTVQDAPKSTGVLEVDAEKQIAEKSTAEAEKVEVVAEIDSAILEKTIDAVANIAPDSETQEAIADAVAELNDVKDQLAAGASDDENLIKSVGRAFFKLRECIVHTYDGSKLSNEDEEARLKVANEAFKDILESNPAIRNYISNELMSNTISSIEKLRGNLCEESAPKLSKGLRPLVEPLCNLRDAVENLTKSEDDSLEKSSIKMVTLQSCLMDMFFKCDDLSTNQAHKELQEALINAQDILLKIHDHFDNSGQFIPRIEISEDVSRLAEPLENILKLLAGVVEEIPDVSEVAEQIEQKTLEDSKKQAEESEVASEKLVAETSKTEAEEAEVGQLEASAQKPEATEVKSAESKTAEVSQVKDEIIEEQQLEDSQKAEVSEVKAEQLAGEKSLTEPESLQVVEVAKDEKKPVESEVTPAEAKKADTSEVKAQSGEEKKVEDNRKEAEVSEIVKKDEVAETSIVELQKVAVIEGEVAPEKPEVTEVTSQEPLKPDVSEVKAEKIEERQVEAIEKKALVSEVAPEVASGQKSVTEPEAVETKEVSDVAQKPDEKVIEPTEAKAADVSEVKPEIIEKKQLEDSKKDAKVLDVAPEKAAAEVSITEAEKVEVGKVEETARKPIEVDVEAGESKAAEISEVKAEQAEVKILEDAKKQQEIADVSSKQEIAEKSVTEAEAILQEKVDEVAQKPGELEVKSPEKKAAEKSVTEAEAIVQEKVDEIAQKPGEVEVKSPEKKAAKKSVTEAEAIVQEKVDEIAQKPGEVEVKSPEKKAAEKSVTEAEAIVQEKVDEIAQKPGEVEVKSPEKKAAEKSVTEAEAIVQEKVDEIAQKPGEVEVKSPEKMAAEKSVTEAEAIVQEKVDEIAQKPGEVEVKSPEKKAAEKSVTEAEAIVQEKVNEVAQKPGELEVKSPEKKAGEKSVTEAEAIVQENVEDSTQKPEELEVKPSETKTADVSEVKPEVVEKKELGDDKKKVHVSDVAGEKQSAEKSVTEALTAENIEGKEVPLKPEEKLLKQAETQKADVSEVKAETIKEEVVPDTKAAQVSEITAEKLLAEKSTTEPEKVDPAKVADEAKKVEEKDVSSVDTQKAEVSEVTPERIEEKAVEDSKKEVKSVEVTSEKLVAEKSVTKPETAEVGQVVESVQKSKLEDIAVAEAQKADANDVEPEVIEKKTLEESLQKPEIAVVRLDTQEATKSVTEAENVEAKAVSETAQKAEATVLEAPEVKKPEVSEVKSEAVQKPEEKSLETEEPKKAESSDVEPKKVKRKKSKASPEKKKEEETPQAPTEDVKLEEVQKPEEKVAEPSEPKKEAVSELEEKRDDDGKKVKRRKSKASPEKKKEEESAVPTIEVEQKSEEKIGEPVDGKKDDAQGQEKKDGEDKKLKRRKSKTSPERKTEDAKPVPEKTEVEQIPEVVQKPEEKLPVSVAEETATVLEPTEKPPAIKEINVKILENALKTVQSISSDVQVQQLLESTVADLSNLNEQLKTGAEDENLLKSVSKSYLKLREKIVHTYDESLLPSKDKEEKLDEIKSSFKEALDASPALRKYVSNELMHNSLSVMEKLKNTLMQKSTEKTAKSLVRLIEPLSNLQTAVESLTKGEDEAFDKSSGRMVNLQSCLMDMYFSCDDVQLNVDTKLLKIVQSVMKTMLNIHDQVENVVQSVDRVGMAEGVDQISSPLKKIYDVLMAIQEEAEEITLEEEEVKEEKEKVQEQVELDKKVEEEKEVAQVEVLEEIAQKSEAVELKQAEDKKVELEKVEEKHEEVINKKQKIEAVSPEKGVAETSVTEGEIGTKEAVPDSREQPAVIEQSELLKADVAEVKLEQVEKKQVDASKKKSPKASPKKKKAEVAEPEVEKQLEEVKESKPEVEAQKSEEAEETKPESPERSKASEVEEIKEPKKKSKLSPKKKAAAKESEPSEALKASEEAEKLKGETEKKETTVTPLGQEEGKVDESTKTAKAPEEAQDLKTETAKKEVAVTPETVEVGKIEEIKTKTEVTDVPLVEEQNAEVSEVKRESIETKVVEDTKKKVKTSKLSPKKKVGEKSVTEAEVAEAKTVTKISQQPESADVKPTEAQKPEVSDIKIEEKKPVEVKIEDVLKAVVSETKSEEAKAEGEVTGKEKSYETKFAEVDKLAITEEDKTQKPELIEEKATEAQKPIVPDTKPEEVKEKQIINDGKKVSEEISKVEAITPETAKDEKPAEGKKEEVETKTTEEPKKKPRTSKLSPKKKSAEKAVIESEASTVQKEAQKAEEVPVKTPETPAVLEAKPDDVNKIKEVAEEKTIEKTPTKPTSEDVKVQEFQKAEVSEVKAEIVEKKEVEDTKKKAIITKLSPKKKSTEKSITEPETAETQDISETAQKVDIQSVVAQKPHVSEAKAEEVEKTQKAAETVDIKTAEIEKLKEVVVDNEKKPEEKITENSAVESEVKEIQKISPEVKETKTSESQKSETVEVKPEEVEKKEVVETKPKIAKKPSPRKKVVKKTTEAETNDDATKTEKTVSKDEVKLEAEKSITDETKPQPTEVKKSVPEEPKDKPSEVVPEESTKTEKNLAEETQKPVEAENIPEVQPGLDLKKKTSPEKIMFPEAGDVKKPDVQEQKPEKTVQPETPKVLEDTKAPVDTKKKDKKASPEKIAENDVPKEPIKTEDETKALKEKQEPQASKEKPEETDDSKKKSDAPKDEKAAEPTKKKIKTPKASPKKTVAEKLDEKTKELPKAEEKVTEHPKAEVTEKKESEDDKTKKMDKAEAQELPKVKAEKKEVEDQKTKPEEKIKEPSKADITDAKSKKTEKSETKEPEKIEEKEDVTDKKDVKSKKTKKPETKEETQKPEEKVVEPPNAEVIDNKDVKSQKTDKPETKDLQKPEEKVAEPPNAEVIHKKAVKTKKTDKSEAKEPQKIEEKVAKKKEIEDVTTKKTEEAKVAEKEPDKKETQTDEDIKPTEIKKEEEEPKRRVRTRKAEAEKMDEATEKSVISEVKPEQNGTKEEAKRKVEEAPEIIESMRKETEQKKLTETESQKTKKSEAPRDLPVKDRKKESKRPPNVDLKLTNRNSPLGSDIKLTCCISGTDVTTQWYKDKTSINHGNKYAISSTDGLSSLEIRSVEKSDSGIYRCVASNPNGDIETSCLVSVYEVPTAKSGTPPIFTRNIRDTYQSASNQIVLECKVSGNPKPNIFWQKDNVLLELPSDKYQVVELLEGIKQLIIANPSRDDSGLYTCYAESVGGQMKLSKFLDVTDHVKVQKVQKISPQLDEGLVVDMQEEKEKAVKTREAKRKLNVEASMKNMVLGSGSKAQLLCNVSGPIDEVQWYKNGERVFKDSRHKIYNINGTISLEIYDASPDDSGEYTCIARNAQYQIENKCSLRIYDSSSGYKPPESFASAIRESFDAHRNEIVLECNVHGRPRITWLRDDHLISNNRYRQIEEAGGLRKLLIRNPISSDYGSFACYAETEDQIEAIAVTLRAADIKKIMTVTNGHTDTSSTDDLYKHHRSSTKDQEEEFTRGRSAARDGSYSSEVKRKPVFSVLLNDRTVAEGSNVRLTCNVVGDSQISWLKNHNPLPADPRYQKHFTNGTAALEIFSAQADDSGNYTCRAFNEYGETLSYAQVKVYQSYDDAPQPPTFIRYMRDTYSLNENELVLDCRVRGKPRPEIQWMKDNDMIYPDDKYRTIAQADGYCKLIINNPTEKDAGRYSCIARNTVHEEKISHQVDFAGREKFILEKTHGFFHRDPNKPHLTNPLGNQTVTPGGTIAIQAEFLPTSSPIDVQWFRDKIPLAGVPNVKTFLDHGVYTLAISNAAQEWEGTYTCRATNAFGKIESHANVDIAAKGGKTAGPPLFLSRPETEMKIAVGDPFSLSFRLQGEPKPKLTLLKGTRDITKSDRVSKEASDDYIRFTVQKSQVADSGTYFVVARNEFGTDRVFSTITIASPKKK